MRGIKALILPLLILVAWLLVDNSQRFSVEQPKFELLPLAILPPKTDPPPGPTPWTQAWQATATVHEVTLDGVKLGQRVRPAKGAVDTSKLREHGKLTLDSDSYVESYFGGECLQSLRNGKTIARGESCERLLRILGEPVKRSQGTCGVGPFEYWHYRVEGGFLVVRTVMEAYPSEKNNQIPAEFRGGIIDLSLSRDDKGSLELGF